MEQRLLIKNVRPMGAETVDVLIEDGFICQIEVNIKPAHESIDLVDGRNQLLLPGLVNAHAHVDKNLLGYPWHRNEMTGRTIREYVDTERRLKRELGTSAEIQSAHELRRAIAYGVTHIRSHIDVDAEAGLGNWEGVLATKEAFQDVVTMQLVPFPQGGMLVKPSSAELLETAVKMGADAIGGLDPSTMDRDPVKHLDTVFAIAERNDVDVDIHLHEPGMLGAFSVELIAERTRALGMQGRVTISHVFCLGMVEEAYLSHLIDLLLENQIAIMSLGSGNSPFPPLKRLVEAGVTVCTGSDGIRDTWGPYNSADMLDRVRLLGYRSGFRQDADVEMLLNIATYGGATVMNVPNYGLQVGAVADLVIVEGDTPTEAIMTRPPRSTVIKNGRVVATNGKFLALN